jgi:cell wall-associated NlpC family hydrolase
MLNKKIFVCSFFLILNFIFAAKIFAADTTVINLPVANIYTHPEDDSDVTTQALYASPVEILQTKGKWVEIKTDDDYRGWIKSKDLAQLKMSSNNTATVNNLFACIYREPDTMKHSPLLLAPFGVKLPVANIKDERWLAVSMPDGVTGWIQQGDVNLNAKPLSLSEMLKLSPRFVGLPYRWAGTSPFGFDCSGFVQFLYRQIGIVLPRDGHLQVVWPRLIEIAKEDLQPGDILYFGWNNVISHAGVYLGDNQFINSTAYKNPSVQISDLRLPHWKDIFITARRLDPTWPKMLPFKSSIEPIPEKIQPLMQQHTWHEGCPVAIDELSYVKVSHWGFDNKVHEGALIVNNKVAQEVISIFHELYAARFPINKIKPIESYAGNDHDSMIDNNTSAFNCRAMVDFNDQYSIHSYGTAIDINPLVNPYINGSKIDPKEGAEYQDRQAYHKGKITNYSPAYRVFTKYGWTWGGDWPDRNKIKDYQHFEKIVH